MPGIKKKWIKASHNEQVMADMPVGDVADLPTVEAGETGEEDRELGNVEMQEVPPKTKKATAETGQSGMLKYLTGDVLMEKRKRFVPPAELKLNEWLDNNLEKRTEETLNLTQLYNYFTEICQGDAGVIVDVVQFNQIIRRKYGKAFGLKEGSIYKSVLKERKLNQEKKKAAGGISLKDAAYEAINFYNNPWGGVRFFNLKQYIGSKYPGLRIDMRPKSLKRTLEIQQSYGKIDLVKGVGMSGFYKIPGGEEPPPKVKKAKKEGDVSTGEDADKEDKNKDEDKDKEGDKEEEEEGSKKDSETKENGEAKDAENEEAEPAVKKSSKPKKVHHVKYSEIMHGSPQKIEDTFPLAITYQSAPKAVGIARIRKYVLDKYGNEVSDSRWRSAIDRGVEKGWWEHVSGTGITGRLHLLMDDFDPSSIQIEDQICGAIIACHEPKSASAGSIKKYITSYHPDFNVEQRPDKFKKALIRAMEKNIIVQLSGLGASGSFALTSTFTPSPSVLAGEDDSEDEDEEEVVAEYKTKGTKSRGIPKFATSPSRLKSYSGRKKPTAIRGRGRQARVKSYAQDSEDEEVVPKKKARANSRSKSSAKAKKEPAKSAKKGKSPKKKARAPSPLTDEEEEEEVQPKKGRKSPAKKNSKARQRSLSPLTDEEEEQAPAQKPKGKTTKAHIVKGKGLKMNIKTENSSSRSRSKQPVTEDSDVGDESEHEESPEPTPSKRRSRGASNTNSKGSMYAESEDDDVEPEYTPKKSKSRGGSAKKRKR